MSTIVIHIVSCERGPDWSPCSEEETEARSQEELTLVT